MANDLENLARTIAIYHFEHNDSAHPITFISGWLEANIGQLNGYTNGEFAVTGVGNFSPTLEPVEKAIFTCLYEMDYYRREHRKALRGVTTDVVDWSMLKEGDSVIQKTTKHQLAKSFAEAERVTNDKLGDLVAKYNIFKAQPLQVAGDDYLPYYLEDPRENSS